MHALWALFALAALWSAAHAQESETTENADTPTSQAASDDNGDTVDGESEKTSETEKADSPWQAESDESTAGPDIYLLPDEETGKLRRILGFQYEDFQRIWQQQRKNRPTAPPLFTISNIDVKGNAEDSHARFEINLEIVPRSKDLVRVPLQMQNLNLLSWELEEQSEVEFFGFDSKEKSYVLWLKSEPGKSRRLTIRGLVKLSRGASNLGLEIELPHAAKSQIIFRVPEEDVQFEASPGISLEDRVSEEGGTEVELTGQASPLQLQWGTSDERNRFDEIVFEAEGDVSVHVDRYRVHYDATFKIDSYGKPLDRIRVLLPEGAKLTKETLSSEYRIINPVEEDGIVIIQLAEPSSEPWLLHLTAEQQRTENSELESDFDESDCTVSGFDVLEAFRQSGTVKLSLDEQLQAFFDLDRDIEQVPVSSESSGTSEQTVVAQFEYARLPWELKVHTVARKQRVSVVPKYNLKISQNQAEVRLDFDYQFTGAYTPSVRIKMHEWDITDDPIESGDMVNLDRIESEQQDLLVLPFKDSKTERVHVSLIARREIKVGHVELPLPEPLYAFVLPGQLTIESDPSLRVTRSSTGTRGISIAAAENSADSLLNNKTRNNRSSNKDTLELRTFLADAVLGADIAQREREVAVDIDSTVNIDREKIAVSQKLKYDVRYQPISQLELQIPEQLWENDSLQVLLDGEEVPIGLGIFSEEMPVGNGEVGSLDDRNEPPESAENPAVVKIRQLIVSLPRPIQSEFGLEINYEQTNLQREEETTTPVSLPLIAPEDLIRSNTLSVITANTIRATLDQTADRGPWNATLGNADEETSALRFKGTGKPTMVPLFMQLESNDEADLATLELTWLQTWIVGDLLQDRAVFKFRTKQPTVVVQLPLELNKPAVEVILDGVTIEFNETPTNRLTIPIPTGNSISSHTLEIRYQRPVELTSWGNLEAKMPRLDSRGDVAPVFWQLILPRGWHVASTPDQLSGEYWIGWQDYLWGRHPTFYQPQLEERTGASSAPPPASPNQYLYRGFRIPRNVSVLVVGQAWLVFTSTLLAFGIGMLVISTPIIRYSLFWLILALAIAGLVVVLPALSMLAVQAIFWAGLMTIAAAVLRQLFVGTTRPYVVMDMDLESASTAVTASWQPESDSNQLTQKSQATSLHSGGSAL